MLFCHLWSTLWELNLNLEKVTFFKYTPFHFHQLFQQVTFVFQYLSKGDVVIGQIVEKIDTGLILELLCFDGKRRDIQDLNLRVFCPSSCTNRVNYEVKDFVRAVVVNIIKDSKIIVSMKDDTLPEEKKPLYKLVGCYLVYS